VSRTQRRVPYIDLRISSITQLPRLAFRYGEA